MLSEADIEFMRASQGEIYELRKRPIDVIYTQEIYDDFTGELVSRTEESKRIDAVITTFHQVRRICSRYNSDEATIFPYQ